MTAGETRVAVLGLGYVGIPITLRAVEVGFDVVAYDVDAEIVARLADGRTNVEDVAGARLASALASGRLRPSSDPADLAGFDVAVICVPTPLRDRVPDLSYIADAARTLAPHVRPGCTVVLESTTYPGTTQELVAPLLEAGSGLAAGDDFHLGYSPERIDPGNPEWRFENIPKVVSGVDAASLEAVSRFYDVLVEKTVPVPSPKEAELTKLLENTFRHVNIALVNEFALFAADLGVDLWASIDAASTKPFGFMRFTPGPGVGGHCLPIDPSYLSWHVRQRVGTSFRFVELANDVNEHMPDFVVRRIILHFNRRGLSVSARRVLLLGLAYKRNTSDARESPTQPIARQLVDLGADVRIADPHVDPRLLPAGTIPVEATRDEAAAADLVVLLVDHSQFDLDAIADAASHVLDTRGRVTGPNVERL